MLELLVVGALIYYVYALPHIVEDLYNGPKFTPLKEKDVDNKVRLVDSSSWTGRY